MNLQKIQIQREGHRRFIEKYLEKIEQSKENDSMTDFDAILKAIEAKVNILETLNEKILSQTEVEGLEEEIFQTDDYTVQMDIKLSHLRAFRGQQEKRTEPELPRDDQRNSRDQQRNNNGLNPDANFFLPGRTVSHTSNNSVNSAQFYRLPKISLPCFGGDILQWQSFWDSYESTIHMNANLTDVQRFTYLKSQLEGTAARVIEGFAMTNANYARAIDLLKERFGQQHKIIHASMQALLQLPAPSSRVSSLRNFHDKMETYIRSLEAMGQCQDTYGNLLVPVVLDKMPIDIRRQLARENGDNNWLLEDLRRAINREIGILETGSARCEPEVDDFNATASFLTSANNRKNTPYPRPGTGSLSRRTEIKCAFCEKDHKSHECKTYTDTESRLSIVKEKHLCFNCLGRHQVAKCGSSKRCQICKRKHHTTICRTREKENQTMLASVEATSPEAAILHSYTRLPDKDVLLKTAIATVSSRDVQTETNILFDEGAQKSFITEHLAQELELTRDGRETILLSSFGSTSNKVQQTDVATVNVVTDRGQKIPVRVLIVPTISTPLNQRFQQTVSDLPYLRGLKLAHPVTGDSIFTISMLIGADSYWDIVEDHIVRGNRPTAVKSKIGYLLSGPLQAHNSRTSDHVFNVMASPMTTDVLERFWNLESMGVTQNTDDIDKTHYFKEYQHSSIEYENGRYTAKLPWKLDHSPLPSNYDIVKTRTENTIRRLRKEPHLLEKYDEIIKEQERRGFIERVENDTQPTGQIHYIPHHPVKKNSATTPIRIVYDCSCRISPHLPSLNDCLESTPSMLNDLTTILMKFRLHGYAITTDIEKAFLHVGLYEGDRDATRFLWTSDIGNTDSPLHTYRFKSVLFGATCSPFMLSATILKHLELNKHVHAAEIIEKDIYVDNVLSSFEKESDLLTYFTESRSLMSSAGMNLRSWTSNSKTLRSRAEAENVLDCDDVVKILGMRWDPVKDEMLYAERNIPILDVVTKRTILKYSSQIYDPLGLLSPVTVSAKILLQELWKAKYDWDTPLPNHIRETWNQLAKSLNRATDVKFPRQLLPSANINSETSLHIFVDASVKSYGAAAYICDKSQARLIMAKNREAPLKTLTLPQLELMAALIGARLSSHLQESLHTMSVTFWSDSQIVLHWLTTSKSLKRFVRNRIDEIHQLTDGSSWRYCPTNDNPADLLTRGISADTYLDNQLWHAGPTWLPYTEKWPTWKYDQSALQTTSEDEDTSSKRTTNVVTLKCTETTGVHTVINVEKYSTYLKLLRVTAYVYRFVENCRRPRVDRLTSSLSVTELNEAEVKWLKSCQITNFQDEIENIKSNSTRLPLVRQLRLYIDPKGILRCGGRIHNAPLQYDTKFPYLLPKKHTLTKLIVFDVHQNQLHSGVNGTITQIRQKYWIPSIRQCVRSLLRTCVKCTRIIGRPYRAPDPPPLPKVRVSEAPPFSVTGVDFTGALFVKNATGNETKCYICLFTCASTRAVHLEVVPNLSTDSFLQAFRRFASRKSLPMVIISDNATTYISAANHLKKLFNSTIVQEELSRKGTEWRFIPKRAPWYGGFWERLIGLTKTSLKKILGRRYVSMETLQTIVTEVEAVMNDRPLTHVSSNIDDLEPLTPSHLLYGRKMTSLPHHEHVSNNDVTIIQSDQTTLTNRAKRQSHITEQFWRRWKSEYLTALREYHTTTGSDEKRIRVGDVVQIYDEGPRIRWKLAIVLELITGNDGSVRAAKIKTKHGITNRPIVKLYPLETVSDIE